MSGTEFDASVAHQARMYDYLLGGVVRVEDWRPEPGTDGGAGNSALWGAVGRKR